MWNISSAGVKYLFRFESHVVQQSQTMIYKQIGCCPNVTEDVKDFTRKVLNLLLNIEFIMRAEGFIPYMTTTSDNDILRIYSPSQNKQMVGN